MGEDINTDDQAGEVIVVAGDQTVFVVPADLPDPCVIRQRDRFEAPDANLRFRALRPDHELRGDKESDAHIIVARRD